MKQLRNLDVIKEVLAVHREELRSVYHVQTIALFGSVVRGDYGPGSDVDILVEFDRRVGWEVVDLHEYLERLLGITVDLVTRRAVERKPLLWRSIQEDMIRV